MRNRSNISLLKYVSSNYDSYLLFIKEFLPNNKDLKILDFGCGAGKLLNVLNESDINCELYGVDIFENQSLFETTKENAPFAEIKELNHMRNLILVKNLTLFYPIKFLNILKIWIIFINIYRKF